MKHRLYFETLDWPTYWKNFFRQDKDSFERALRSELTTDQVFLTRSGRSALLVSLLAAGLKRDDEVLLGGYTNKCILNVLTEAATLIPAYKITPKTKAVVLYHQWGFAQDFTRMKDVFESAGLFIIENCVNSLWGSRDGWRVGEIGDTAIFSLTKVFEMTYAGALRVNRPDLTGFVTDILSKPVSWRDIKESLRGEMIYMRVNALPPRLREAPDIQMDVRTWHSSLLNYHRCVTVRGCIPRDESEVKFIFNKQHQHFMFLLKLSRNPMFMLAGDDIESMAPLCFPVISEDSDFLKSVSLWLEKRNIFTGIYHFDVKRNMLDPLYKKCVPVPLCASIPLRLLEDFYQEFKGGF